MQCSFSSRFNDHPWLISLPCASTWLAFVPLSLARARQLSWPLSESHAILNYSLKLSVGLIILPYDCLSLTMDMHSGWFIWIIKLGNQQSVCVSSSQYWSSFRIKNWMLILPILNSVLPQTLDFLLFHLVFFDFSSTFHRCVAAHFSVGKVAPTQSLSLSQETTYILVQGEDVLIATNFAI